MKIIISPAKTMCINTDNIAPVGSPVFIDKTKEILSYLQSLSYEEIKGLWKCSDKIAKDNFLRLKDTDLYSLLTPAILAYDGIAYKYMSPVIFEKAHFEYAQKNLRILSAFYGVLKPMDGITSYRLEMMAKAKISGSANLYKFWGSDIYNEVRDESGLFINLASKEYSRCIEDFATEKDTIVSYTFGELKNDEVIQKTVYVKMARGEMVRFMAENNVTDPSGTKSFNRLGFSFDEKRSRDSHFIFLK